MKRTEILEKVQHVVSDVLDLEDLVISEETTASEVEDWDSIMHVEIIVELENTFDVKFRTVEIEDFKKVGDIVSSIESKIIA